MFQDRIKFEVSLLISHLLGVKVIIEAVKVDRRAYQGSFDVEFSIAVYMHQNPNYELLL